MTESTISTPRRGVPIWAQIIIWVFLVGLLAIVAVGLSRAQQGTVQPGQVIDNFTLPLYSGYELDGKSEINMEAMRGQVIVINPGRAVPFTQNSKATILATNLVAQRNELLDWFRHSGSKP